MNEAELAAKCLRTLAASNSKRDLQTLASKAGMHLEEALMKFAHIEFAKCLIKGSEPTSCHLVNACCLQVQH